MKKEIILFVLALLIMVSSGIVHSQEPKKFYSKIVFQAEDAKGNIDTVVAWVKKKSADDKEPDNLYGQPPKGDLDMRLIQRKDTTNKGGAWLGWWPIEYCWGMDGIKFFPENLDLKIDNRYETTEHWHLLDTDDFRYNYREYFVIQVHAKHYPVKISIKNWVSKTWAKELGRCYGIWTRLYTYNGKSVREDLDFLNFSWSANCNIQGTDTTYILAKDTLVYEFEDATKNHLIGFFTCYESGDNVSDTDINQSVLYPNPSSKFITIEDGNYNERFDIVDIKGQIVSFVIVENYPYNLDISNLPKGTYFLQNSKGMINKFVKE